MPLEPKTELPLEADPDILAALAALLPPGYVNMRRGWITMSYVPSLAVEALRDALAKGYTIDRTNADGPLEEWDGWLVISSPVETFIQLRRNAPTG